MAAAYRATTFQLSAVAGRRGNRRRRRWPPNGSGGHRFGGAVVVVVIIIIIITIIIIIHPSIISGARSLSCARSAASLRVESSRVD